MNINIHFDLLFIKNHIKLKKYKCKHKTSPDTNTKENAVCCLRGTPNYIHASTVTVIVMEAGTGTETETETETEKQNTCS